MKMQEMSKLFDRPIAFHRSFVDLSAAGVTGALFLSQLWYWSYRTNDPAGWVYKTQTDWQEETGLTPGEQRTARKHLQAAGLIEEELRGVPAQLYYRVCADAILAALNIQLLGNLTTGSAETSQQGVRNAPIFNKEPETTPETTTSIPRQAELLRIQNALQSSQPVLDYSGLNLLDLRGYPPDVIEVITLVCSLWHLRPPAGKAKAYWIQSARGLVDACGEFGPALLERVWRAYDEHMEKHEGIPPYTVEGPGSLEKVARAEAGLRRGEAAAGEAGSGDVISPDDYYVRFPGRPR